MTSGDDVAQSARVNNYWQGGTDNFAADRAAAQQAMNAFPQLPDAVRAGGALRYRVVRYLVGEQGIRQVLDLGAGLPASAPVLEMALGFDPRATVFSVDTDPLVIAKLKDSLLADVRDTATVLGQAAKKLDLGQPTGILMSSLLHLIPDSDDPRGLVDSYLAAVPSGSFLMIVHPASDIHPEASRQMQSKLNDQVAQKRRYRSRDEVAEFFAGLELVEPGLVPAPQWRPDTEEEAKAPTMAWCGVARKP